MKILRAFAIGLIALITFAGVTYLSAYIGASMEHDLAAIATAFIGLLIGVPLGVITAILAAIFFARHIWVGGKKTGEVLK